ncbi:Transcription elongation factor SPT5 [Coccomyxa sp. Obi]|nr:Transcription elongation factor SPT5 [Coccomyxa sp. Obi]
MARTEKRLTKAKKQRGDSDDKDEDLEDDLQGEEDDLAPSAKRRRSAFIDDAAEEEDDEDDEEDEGDGRRGKKRLKRSRFVDDIAAVDEDEEEEEDDQDEGDDQFLLDEGEELPEVEDVGRRYDDRAAMIRRQDEELDAEQLEAYVQQRFGNQRDAAADFGDGVEAGAVQQQALLPTHADPKLWTVETRGGSAREACVKLMQKAINKAAAGEPLLIRSVFYQEHLKGYIYVEAHKESHVKEAIRGLTCLFYGKGGQLVPMKEMVDAITVKSTAKGSNIEEGAWVRVKIGPYSGDLGKVVSVDYNADTAHVKVIPRLDYAAMVPKEERREQGPPATGRKPRPPARAFSLADAKDQGLIVEQRRKPGGSGNYYILKNQHYEDGYLIKQYGRARLELVSGLPPLEELQRFNEVGMSSRTDDDPEGGELAQLMRSLGEGAENGATVRYEKGDKVVVTSGDLTNLRGRVTNVLSDGRVEVMPTQLGLNEALTFDASQLRKFFEAGDYVRVNSGQHEGQTGMIVSVEEPICVLMTDATREQLQVFTRDLAESSNVASGVDTFGAYELHDLVVLDQTTVGVIISVAKDSCKVLTNKGSVDQPMVRVCRAVDIKRKVTREGSAMDSSHREIARDSVVDMMDGRLKGRSGTVKHIFKKQLFLHLNDLLENGGFVCVMSHKVKAKGGKGPAGATGGVKAGLANALRSPNPYALGMVPASPRIGGFGAAPPPRFGGGRGDGPPGGGFGASRGGYGSGGGRGGGRGGPDDRMIGQITTISKGPFRGYRGRIIKVTPTEVRVELEAQQRSVGVPRDAIPPEHGGAPLPREPPRFGAAPNTPAHLGMATPRHSWGAQTPMHPGATPMHSMMTPSHPGMATPGRDAWNPNLDLATPAHPSSNPGPSTATPGTYGGGYAAADTPAFTPAFTPAEAPAPTPAGFNDTGSSWGTGAASGGWTPALPTGGPPTVGATPGGPTPGYYPTPAATPGIGASAYDPGSGQTTGVTTGPDWRLYEGIAVALADSGRVGVVRSISSDGVASVALGSEDPEKRLQLPDKPEVIQTAGSNLQLLPTKKKDVIRVIAGDFQGKMGQCLNMADADAIVKLDDGDMKVMEKGVVGWLFGRTS